MRFHFICLIFIFIFTASLFFTTQLSQGVIRTPLLDVDVKTDKQVYDIGDRVVVSANTTLDGRPTASLVAVEACDPYGDPYIIRTIKTGDVSSKIWRLQIVDFYTCNSIGVMKTTFNRGDMGFINLTIKNTDNYNAYRVHAGIYIELLSSNKAPLLAFYPFAITIQKGQTIRSLFSFHIHPASSTGEAKVYANLFSDSPKNMGYAYCPEKTTIFYIESPTPAIPPQPNHSNATFTLPRGCIKLGNYTIYATSIYWVQTKMDMRQINVTLKGDIYKDYRINMRDITAAVLLFQTTPASPNWNPIADVVKDDIINMRDINYLVLGFGKEAEP